jgi:hypothetical protein
MKKLILSIAVCFQVQQAQAAFLEAKPVADLVATIETTQLKYKETGKMFGFNSTQSCLYAGEDFIVVKNYCFPKRPYPAKSFTIISAKFGLIELYQEQLSQEIHKRDVRINVFPEPIRKYITGSLADSTVESASKLIETLHYQYGPACWSTNFDYNYEVPVAKCNTNEVVDFDLWAAETQALTGDNKAYQQLFERIEAVLPTFAPQQ